MGLLGSCQQRSRPGHSRPSVVCIQTSKACAGSRFEVPIAPGHHTQMGLFLECDNRCVYQLIGATSCRLPRLPLKDTGEGFFCALTSAVSEIQIGLDLRDASHLLHTRAFLLASSIKAGWPWRTTEALR